MNRRLEPFVVAVLACAAGLLLRVPVWPHLEGHTPFITFYPAVVFAAFWSGRAAGLVTAVFGAMAALYFVIFPQFAWTVPKLHESIALVFFLVNSAFITVVIDKLREARRDADTQKRITQRTLASIADAVIATDVDGHITFINRVAEQLTGWSRQEALGQPLSTVFVPEDGSTGERVESPVAQVLREGTAATLPKGVVLRTREGNTTPVEDSGAPILDAGGSCIGAVLVFRSVAEQRAAERRLAVTERRLSQLAKANVIGILFGDIYGNIRDANDELLRMIGRSRQELNAGGLRWVDITPRQYAAADSAALAEARETGACTPYEKEYIRADGSRVPILIGYVLLEPDRVESVAFIVDLTDRKRAYQDLQAFTYGASHDLKEPLRMVTSYSQLLARRNKGKLDSDSEEYIGFILAGVERMRALVDALLDYSRAGEVLRLPTGAVDSRVALNNSLVALHTSITEASADVSADDSLPLVLVHETHLVQVFQNLIGNAIKYGARRVVVSAKSADGCCTFCVTDDGPGIASEQHERIFEAFQRLHGRDNPGSGLGLATCRRIVERHGGRIWVESDGKSGSTFCFRLRTASTESGEPV